MCAMSSTYEPTHTSCAPHMSHHSCVFVSATYEFVTHMSHDIHDVWRSCVALMCHELIRGAHDTHEYLICGAHVCEPHISTHEFVSCTYEFVSCRSLMCVSPTYPHMSILMCGRTHDRQLTNSYVQLTNSYVALTNTHE